VGALHERVSRSVDPFLIWDLRNDKQNFPRAFAAFA